MDRNYYWDGFKKTAGEFGMGRDFLIKRAVSLLPMHKILSMFSKLKLARTGASAAAGNLKWKPGVFPKGSMSGIPKSYGTAAPEQAASYVRPASSAAAQPVTAMPFGRSAGGYSPDERYGDIYDLFKGQ